jgi:hypothetical protein
MEPEHLVKESLPKVEHKFIGTGKQGNLNTVKHIQKIAHQRKSHPLVRELALRILLEKNIPSQHHLSEAKAIGEYVKRKLRYVRDIRGIETVYDPVTLIDRITKGIAQADCDDHVVLICALLLSVGIQPYVRVVKYDPNISHFNHIYVVVYEKNWGMKKPVRLVLDAIVKRRPIGFEVKHHHGKEIKV